MDGKRLILFVVIITVVGVIAAWLWGESVIEKYDLDRAISTIQLIR